MMKGNQTFKWTEAGKKSFENIKEAITNAPVLVHPDYNKEFIIYCYFFRTYYFSHINARK